MVTFKRLSECKLDEVVKTWNEGFAGYFFDATMTVDRFLTRFVLEELSATLSFIAYENLKPVGIALNGVRQIQDSCIAWNGGTAVVEECRGTGVSGALIEHALQLYREEHVQTATLEAICENEKAIRLYQGKGYEIRDHILYMSNDNALPELIDAGRADYAYRYGTPHDVQGYATLIPWQSQWQNFRRDGETVLVHENERLIAYALFKRTYDADGTHTGVAVGQVQVLEDREDQEQLLRFLLSKTLQPERANYKRTLPVLASNTALLQVLQTHSFKQTQSQVWMTQKL